MQGKLLKIWNIISWVLISIILAIAVLVVALRMMGYKYYTVISGSMEPEYKVGSVILVKNVNAKDINKGDVITFKLSSSDAIATHRVVEVLDDSQQFITKGDANEKNDNSPVEYSNLIGKVSMRVPLMRGNFLSFITGTAGKIVSVIILVAFVCLLFLPEILNKVKKFTDENNDKKPHKKGINSSDGETNT